MDQTNLLRLLYVSFLYFFCCNLQPLQININSNAILVFLPNGILNFFYSSMLKDVECSQLARQKRSAPGGGGSASARRRKTDLASFQRIPAKKEDDAVKKGQPHVCEASLQFCLPIATYVS